MQLSDTIAADRRHLGLSQRDLALRLGISQQAVSKWEEGRAQPRGKHLARLLQELGQESMTALTLGGRQERKNVPTRHAPQTTAPQTDALHAIAAAALELARAAQAIAESVARLAPPPDPPDRH